MSASFAEVVDEAMRRKGWGYNRLSVEIGLLEGGRIFNPTQIRRLRLGERQNLSHELVKRLIAVLDLDPDEAWHAAGLWPPDLDVEEYRKLRLASAANGVSARKVAQPLPLDVDAGEFAQLIDQNRPRLAVVVPLEPRRDRRQEDRRLRALPDVAA